MNNRTVGTLSYTTGGLFVLFFWLLFGEFSIAMRERAAVPSVLELLRQHHASDIVMALLVSALPQVIGMLLGPMISFKSDRYRSARGRRLPFLILPTPIGALAMMGIGMSPWLGAQAHSWLGAGSPGYDFCVLAIFCVFWTIFECIVIITVAIYTGLIADVVPKGLLGRFYACFRIVSLGAGILFNTWIFHLTETHLLEIFVGVGLFFGIGFTLMCLKVKEGSYPDPEPEEAGAGQPAGVLRNARVYFVECFSHPYYLWIFAAMVLALLTFGPFSPMNSYGQWYADSIGMPKETLGRLTALAFGISLFMAFFIGWLVDHTSALRVSIVAMAIYGVCTMVGYFMVTDAASFGIVYVLHVVLAGAYLTAAQSLPMLLFPQLRLMQFTSAAALLGAIASIALSLMLGAMLDLTHHNYSLTLLISALMALAATAILLKVRRNLDGSGDKLVDAALPQAPTALQTQPA